MENSTLLVIAILVIILTLALLGLFVYLVRAMREDNRLAITRLRFITDKIRELDIVNDRTFKEFEMLINRKLQTVFSPRIIQTKDHGNQTDMIAEKGNQDVALQVDMGRVNNLLPPLVRPAESPHVIFTMDDCAKIASKLKQAKSLKEERNWKAIEKHNILSNTPDVVIPINESAEIIQSVLQGFAIRSQHIESLREVNGLPPSLVRPTTCNLQPATSSHVTIPVDDCEQAEGLGEERNLKAIERHNSRMLSRSLHMDSLREERQAEYDSF